MKSIILQSLLSMQSFEVIGNPVIRYGKLLIFQKVSIEEHIYLRERKKNKE